VELQARICGSVYRASLAEGQVTLVQLDPEGTTYTQVKTGTPVVKPVDLSAVKPVTTGLLLWLAADTGVTKGEDGKVSAWKSMGKSELIFAQPDEKRRPTWVSAGPRGKPVLRIERDQQWLAIPDLDAVDQQLGAGFVGEVTIFGVYGNATPKNNRIVSAVADSGHDYEQGIAFNDEGGEVRPADAKDGVLFKAARCAVKKPLKTICVGAMCWGGGNTGMGGNTFGFGGDLAELLVYKGNLAPTVAALVLDYLNDKYAPKAP
jgi:hypothetical protein